MKTATMEYMPLLVKISAILIVICSLALISWRLVNEFLFSEGTDKSEDQFRSKVPPKPRKVEFQPLSQWHIWKQIIGLFILTRLMIFGASVSYAASTGSGSDLLSAMRSWWFEYDSSHYINIAKNGYQSVGEDQNLIVFYPLYPFLIKLGSFIIPNYHTAALVISNLFLLIGLYYLVRLLELEFKNSELALSSTKYVLLFPFSFFFSIIYTESVFVTLCILCFYFLRKSKWLTAGLFGMLAALTRNQGVLLAVPILIEIAVQQNWKEMFRKGQIRLWLRGLLPGIFGVILPVVGTCLYLLINKLVSGDWFRFLFHQKDHWGQTFGFFAENLAEHMNRALTYHNALFNTGVYLPQIILFFVSFGLLIYMTNKMRLSYILFSFSYLIISYSASALLSGGRYVSGMFTLYMFLAYIYNKLNPNYRVYMDWLLLFFLLFFTVVFGLNYVF
ncbi:MAG: putative integral rane protein [Paenibacillus sp.]|nr:putative integral rane protein [Paenibacillus sp.]